jgi:hypothetical protein
VTRQFLCGQGGQSGSAQVLERHPLENHQTGTRIDALYRCSLSFAGIWFPHLRQGNQKTAT